MGSSSVTRRHFPHQPPLNPGVKGGCFRELLFKLEHVFISISHQKSTKIIVFLFKKSTKTKIIGEETQQRVNVYKIPKAEEQVDQR